MVNLHLLESANLSWEKNSIIFENPLFFMHFSGKSYECSYFEKNGLLLSKINDLLFYPKEKISFFFSIKMPLKCFYLIIRRGFIVLSVICTYIVNRVHCTVHCTKICSQYSETYQNKFKNLIWWLHVKHGLLLQGTISLPSSTSRCCLFQGSLISCCFKSPTPNVVSRTLNSLLFPNPEKP